MPVYAASAATLQDAVGETDEGTALSMAGVRRLTVQISGTFVGTVSFQGTIDDTNWFAVGLLTAANGAAVSSATAVGAWKLPLDGPALTQFRANVTAYTSGAITVLALTDSR